jgi:hypothetical protein
MDEPKSIETDSADWPRNYFNYFTEIEEHFQRVRGTTLFLLSPLDWALIENWKASEIPLAAVLKGIDDAFEKWRARKTKRKLINSVAYCAQAVMEAAERAPSAQDQHTSAPPLDAAEVRAHLRKAAEQLRTRPEDGLREQASSLEKIADQIEMHIDDVQALERRLTSMEDKVIATIRSAQTDDELCHMREALENVLRPYRG